MELTSHRLVAKEENLTLALHRVIRVEKEEVQVLYHLISMVYIQLKHRSC